jgi:hypothetical protein
VSVFFFSASYKICSIGITIKEVRETCYYNFTYTHMLIRTHITYEWCKYCFLSATNDE